MDDYPVTELIKERLVVFVCATTGQGEEPDNMKCFWSFLLRKSLPPNSLQEMRQCVIGLGDSSYLKFNFTAKRLHRRLAQLGAHCLLDPLYADEQHELRADGMLDPWLAQFWKIVTDLFPLPAGCLPVSEEILPAPKYTVNCDMACTVSPRLNSDNLFNATVVSNQRVTSPDHFQDVRLIKLNIEGSRMTFEPGDVAVVYPENCEEDIEEFLRLFSLKADMHLIVAPAEDGTPLPRFLSMPVSLDSCVRKYFDLSYIPKRYVQHRIAEHEDKVWQLLCDCGVLYVAGNAKDMMPSVRGAFKAVVKKFGSLTDENAEELLKNMEKSGRLQIEAWS